MAVMSFNLRCHRAAGMQRGRSHLSTVGVSFVLSRRRAGAGAGAGGAEVGAGAGEGGWCWGETLRWVVVVRD